MPLDFTMIAFLSVLALTITAGAGAASIAVFVAKKPPIVQEVIRTLMFMATLGAGAIIALLGNLAVGG